MKPTLTKIIAGFLLLFACYHTAEYLMLYRNSPFGFLAISLLFLPLAFLIARWQGDRNLQGWGLTFSKRFPVYLLTGLLAGLVVSALAFLVSLTLQIEVVSFVPPVRQFLPQAALLIFGSAVSSLTEDMLTRSYIYRHAGKRMSPTFVVLLSAVIYVLNHVHRLGEPVYLLYIFLLGIQLVLPLLITGKIWYTLGVHWAGNIVYHLTSNVMHTEAGGNPLPAMGVMILFTAFAIPVHVFLCRRLVKAVGKTPSANIRNNTRT